jgi:hypothetical protein
MGGEHMYDMRIRTVGNGFVCSFDMYDEKEDETFTEELLFETKGKTKEDKARALQRVIVAMTRYFDIVDDKQYDAMKKRLEVRDDGTVEEDKATSRRKDDGKGGLGQAKGRGAERGPRRP